jgi:hypothetical protein
MTLANFVLEDRRVVAFSDTALYTTGGDLAGRTTKLHLLPHLPAVFVVRGNTAMAVAARSALELHAADFDQALEILPDALRSAYGDSIERLTAQGFGAVAHETMRANIWLSGWSVKRKRMLLFDYASPDGFTPNEHEPGVYLNPPLLGDCPPTITLDQSIQIANSQRDMMKRQADLDGMALSIGGDLHAVEMTPDSMKVRTVYRWPDAVPALASEQVTA